MHMCKIYLLFFLACGQVQMDIRSWYKHLLIGADEYDVPIFGKVVTICTVNRNVSDVIFVLSQLHTVEFIAHYQSYEVSPVLKR